MKIAVQFAGKLPIEIANVWYENLRRYMKHPIVHLTDMVTEALPFADEVQRIEETDVAKAKYRHLAKLKGDVLNLDYDIIVQKDVSDVFNRPFDVALTKRNPVDGKYKMLHMAQPHNTGVVFTRNRKFWERCLERYPKYPENAGWLLGQVCITECFHIYRKKFRFIELPGDLYNYTPKDRNEDLTGRFIIHYKGPRKDWMVNTKAATDEGKRVGELSNDKRLFFTEDHPNFKEIMAEKKRMEEASGNH